MGKLGASHMRVFPLWFSDGGPKSLKNVPKPSKIPSLLSAHAGSYIYKMRDVLAYKAETL
jgi:hypothetical protein